mgnify:CR=1 FL=1
MSDEITQLRNEIEDLKNRLVTTEKLCEAIVAAQCMPALMRDVLKGMNRSLDGRMEFEGNPLAEPLVEMISSHWEKITSEMSPSEFERWSSSKSGVA